MPVFDLGDDLSLTRVVGAPLEETWRRARELLEAYAARGLAVRFVEEDFPLALVARLSDDKGTELAACVELLPDGDNAELTLALAGRVFVGGLEGALAKEGKVRKVARARLERFLDERLADLPPRPRRFASASGATDARRLEVEEAFQAGLLDEEERAALLAKL